MLNLMIRTFVIYIAIIVVMRLMGKRQIAQLQPFEMVISIVIADLAAMPMQDEKIPLLRGLVPLLVLLFFQVIFSFIEFKSKRIRTWLNGVPAVLIANGKLNHSLLQSNMISFGDIVESMHACGISDMDDIDYAILETNGNISCFLKPQLQPMQKKDAQATGDGFSVPVIMNGKFLDDYMEFSSMTRDKIINAVQSHGRGVGDVLYCSVTSDGKVKVMFKREGRPKGDKR